MNEQAGVSILSAGTCGSWTPGPGGRGWSLAEVTCLAPGVGQGAPPDPGLYGYHCLHHRRLCHWQDEPL